jgi:uncharacterized protein (TIGR04222 family)
MAFWPFDLDGSQFLKLYGFLLVAASILSIVAGRLFRPVGCEQRLTDPDQLALLSGGESRLLETIVTRMLVNGAILHEGDDNFSLGLQDAAHSAIERDIVKMMPASLANIRDHIKPYGDMIDYQLTNLGLLMKDAESERAQLSSLLPFLLLGCLGFVRVIQGTINDRPVGFLIMLLILTFFVAIILRITDRYTGAGQKMVMFAQGAYERLSAAPTTAEMPMAVAIFGTAVLAGSSMEPLHAAIYPKPSSDSWSSGSSDDGSISDGGGGGGCGGCGGGGD